MANVGFREFLNIKRPAQELIEAFRGIPVANIADQMGRIYCVDAAIKPMNSAPLLGCALTVKAPMGDNLRFHRALDLAQPGDILVIDGAAGMERSLCGEIMMRYAMSRGIGGFLIDGCIRDYEAARELDFPIFARGVTPQGPYKFGPGEINVPVAIGGIAVLPGDIVVGDQDGVVVIRQEDAKELAEKAKKHNDMEAVIFDQIAKRTFDHSWVDKAMETKGVETIRG